MAVKRTKKAGTVYANVKPSPTERCYICGAYVHLHIKPCWKSTSPAAKKGSSND